MLSVVTFKWATPGYRTTFTANHVNALFRGVSRHYPAPHRQICVTDDPVGLECETVPLWDDFAYVPSPHGGNNPSCYRRLKLFDPAIVSVLGPRFVVLDLDCVVTGDLTDLFDRPAEFAMWADPLYPHQYNGSLVLMDAGARRQVWDQFNPWRSPQQALEAGFRGSDQGWISYCLGPNEATVGRVDGVYSYRADVRGRHVLPKNASLVFFHGREKPWDEDPMQKAWVRTACQ